MVSDKCIYDNENLYYAIYLNVREQQVENSSKEGCSKKKLYNSSNGENSDLLLDYNFVYENVEELFIDHSYDYQINQNVEQYYIFFKALTNKYSMETDYQMYLCGEIDKKSLEYKWKKFSIKLIEFLAISYDNLLEQLLEIEDVISYFLKYPIIFEPSTIEIFHGLGMNFFLKYHYYYSYYIKNPRCLFELIKECPDLAVPQSIMLDNDVIRKVSHNFDIETYYYYLHFFQKQTDIIPYIDEHKKYCDDQINNITDGILPCFREMYENFPEIIMPNIRNKFNNDIYSDFILKTIDRIFEKNNSIELSKKFFFQELSKYIAFNLLISRYYETSPYNLLIDIETLYIFVKERNITIKYFDIYDFIVHYENKKLSEIVQLYKEIKGLPLMDILYDDFRSQQNSFINELNNNLFNIDTLVPLKIENGIRYYDITNIDNVLIVHNTSINCYQEYKIEELIERIKNGQKKYICLSIQDKYHRNFFNQYNCGDCIKLLFGKIDPNRVGIVSTKDAGSVSVDSVMWNNFDYIRRLYTLKEFMNETGEFNEICYTIDGVPLLPIGVICDYEIKSSEIEFAEKLKIDIFFRGCDYNNEIGSCFRYGNKCRRRQYSIEPNYHNYYD